MTNHEKTRIDEIVSYTPPQLYTGKEWYIGFMAFDPALGKLHRKRIKINHVHGGVCAKRKYAQDLLKRLNEQLSQGWNPWIEADAKSIEDFGESSIWYANTTNDTSPNYIKMMCSEKRHLLPTLHFYEIYANITSNEIYPSHIFIS